MKNNETLKKLCYNNEQKIMNRLIAEGFKMKEIEFILINGGFFTGSIVMQGVLEENWEGGDIDIYVD